jgi:hypothetical protein
MTFLKPPIVEQLLVLVGGNGETLVWLAALLWARVGRMLTPSDLGGSIGPSCGALCGSPRSTPSDLGGQVWRYTGWSERTRSPTSLWILPVAHASGVAKGCT